MLAIFKGQDLVERLTRLSQGLQAGGGQAIVFRATIIPVLPVFISVVICPAMAAKDAARTQVSRMNFTLMQPGGYDRRLSRKPRNSPVAAMPRDFQGFSLT